MSEQRTEGLLGYVERIESAMEHRDAGNEVMREVYAYAKKAGFVPALVRQIIKERRMEVDERADQYATLDSYREALGLLAGTPLGEAALRSNVTPMPRPFAEQPVHLDRRRGRPRKSAVDAAQELLGA